MKEYFEKNKATLKPLSFRLIFFSFCFVFSLGLNYYLKNTINPSLEGIPVLLYILFAVYYVTKAELKKMLVSNPGRVSLLKFKELYEKYGYSIRLSGFVEHEADECVVAYTNDKEADRVMGTSAFRLFNRYIKIPFVFDYTRDRVIIKSQKAVINLAELSAKDLDAFNPNIANFLKLEYRLSFNQKKLKLKVSDGSNYDLRLNDQNLETLKRLLRQSAFQAD
jgi:hypothetical protein